AVPLDADLYLSTGAAIVKVDGPADVSRWRAVAGVVATGVVAGIVCREGNGGANRICKRRLSRAEGSLAGRSQRERHASVELINGKVTIREVAVCIGD